MDIEQYLRSLALLLTLTSLAIICCSGVDTAHSYWILNQRKKEWGNIASSGLRRLRFKLFNTALIIPSVVFAIYKSIVILGGGGLWSLLHAV